MNEPYRTRFEQLIRGGAASKDVHDAAAEGGFATREGTADDAFVQRELDRVRMHQRSLVPPLERAVVRAPRILDFGCGTGGTTVALALSSLAADEVIGVDANPDVVEAARVRAAGYALSPSRVRFEHVPAGAPLPFDDASFDLVTTISVLEFISAAEVRDGVVASLRRLVRPGGYLYIATPRPGLREYHTRRWLGDVTRSDGLPWSSPPRQTRRWADGWQRIQVVPRQLQRVLAAAPRPVAELGARVALALASPWQKILLRRPT